MKKPGKYIIAIIIKNHIHPLMTSYYVFSLETENLTTHPIPLFQWYRIWVEHLTWGITVYRAAVMANLEGVFDATCKNGLIYKLYKSKCWTIEGSWKWTFLAKKTSHRIEKYS